MNRPDGPADSAPDRLPRPTGDRPVTGASTPTEAPEKSGIHQAGNAGLTSPRARESTCDRSHFGYPALAGIDP